MSQPALHFAISPTAQRALEALRDAPRARRAIAFLRRIAETGGHWPLAQTWNARAPDVVSCSLVSEGLLLFYEVDWAEGRLLLLDVGRG